MTEKKQKLELKYNALKEDIIDKQDKLSESNKKLRKIESQLVVIQEKENSSVENYKTLVEVLKKMIKVLNKKNYPKNPICNHFGVRYSTENWNISISSFEYSKDKMQVVFEIKSLWIGSNQVGCSKRCFDNIRKLMRKEFKIINFWNGKEGFQSISIVFEHPMPKTFLTSLEAYRDK